MHMDVSNQPFLTVRWGCEALPVVGLLEGMEMEISGVAGDLKR